MPPSRRFAAWAVALALAGCGQPPDPVEVAADPAPAAPPAPPPPATDPAPADPAPPKPDAPQAKNPRLEKLPDGRRRVVIDARVCVRKMAVEKTKENPDPHWPIELFLCKENTKEHEAVLHADIDPRALHALLLAAGGEAGGPVRYEPRFWPPHGDTVAITVTYTKDGKPVTEPAQQWVLNSARRKPLAGDWVFAGSKLYPHPDGPDHPPVYGANSGDVICVSNFETALLDVPFASSKENADRMFEANLEKVPPEGTPVTVTLEPIKSKKK